MRDVEIHGDIVGVDFQPSDIKDGRTVVRVAVSSMERIGKWSVWLIDGTQSPPSRRMPDPNVIEWHHLDGTICVDGWDATTGKCSTGGGPVTPRLVVELVPNSGQVVQAGDDA